MKTLPDNYQMITSQTSTTVQVNPPPSQKLPNSDRKQFSTLPVIRFLSLAIFVLILSITNIAAALQKGDSGISVTNLQKNLKTLGYYDGPTTGYYGDLTEAAVNRFQRFNRLTVNGIAGIETLQTLESIMNADTGGRFPGVLSVGSQGDNVVNLQLRLKNLGHYTGPITGYYGELTEIAVRRYQTSKGLNADGVVGRSTWSSLY